MSQNNVSIGKLDSIEEGKILKCLSSTGERKIIKTHKREYSIHIPYYEDEKSEFENAEGGCKRKRV
jgi:hypothetical protein